jgi:hypothetical protein
MGCQSTSAIGFVLNIWLRFAKNGERLESPHLDRQFPTLRIELFGCFETPPLAEAHTWATAIFVDEFDATQDQCALESGACFFRHSWTPLSFNPFHRGQRHSSLFR